MDRRRPSPLPPTPTTQPTSTTHPTPTDKIRHPWSYATNKSTLQPTSGTVPTPHRALMPRTEEAGSCAPGAPMPTSLTSVERGGGVRKQYFQGWWSVFAGRGWRNLASASRHRDERACLPTNAGEGMGPFDPKMDTTTTQKEGQGDGMPLPRVALTTTTTIN